MTSKAEVEESPVRKRLRRSKQDPEFVFEHPNAEEKASETTILPRTSVKKKPKPPPAIDSSDVDADLYVPGDIVWCKLGSFPWWPALVYQCDAEGGIHTKLINSNNKPKRQFFVYFYGKYLEYSWISTRWLLKYAGLSNFIQHAEAAVQQAATKSEQHELANRFQLKVSMKKRMQWDEAIELADRAVSMTKTERIEEFSDLLQEASDTKHHSKNGGRRRKISFTRSEDDGKDEQENKRRARTTSNESNSPTVETTSSAKPSVSLRKPAVFDQNGTKSSSAEEVVTKKRPNRSLKTETEDSDKPSTSTSSVKTRSNRATAKNQPEPSSRSTRSSPRTVVTNGNEVEYDYPSSIMPRPLPINGPLLVVDEQKQIVEELLHHPQGKELTFEDAQTFAMKKALELVQHNQSYSLPLISPEWFYDTILLRYPAVVFRYRSWFENVKTDVIPDGNNFIELKQWQLALMLQAQAKAEQETNANEK